MSLRVSLAEDSITNFDNFDENKLKSVGFRAIADTYDTAQNNSPKGFARLRLTTISTGNPSNNTIDYMGKPGLIMKTSSLRDRNNNTDAITGFRLEKGVYRDWKFIGSQGEDSIYFDSQATIISNITSGVVDFGRDNAKDTFTFTNTINVEKTGHSKYNHLQKVKIINFGREDEINIQGKIYGYGDVKKGVIGDIPADRLSITLIQDPLT